LVGRKKTSRQSGEEHIRTSQNKAFTGIVNEHPAGRQIICSEHIEQPHEWSEYDKLQTRGPATQKHLDTLSLPKV
jgi:hypothetical protein